MDTIRSQDDIGGNDAYDSGAIEAPPAISSQERRMHVRAYNYWVSLLGNRSLPSIEDLNPGDMEDFAANSVLLDFSMGLENPAIIYLGSALREECGITGSIDRADEVPVRSLLSRLTDHYLQIIANAAPVGFEAEFTNQRGTEIMYRGILMPFSSNDETIDFIYGVISWKEVAGKSLTDGLDEEIKAAMGASPVRHSTAPIWADGPSATADYDDGEEWDAEDAIDLTATAKLDATDFGFDDIGFEDIGSDPEATGNADDRFGEAERQADGIASENGEDELDLSAFLDAARTDQPLELKDVVVSDDGNDMPVGSADHDAAEAEDGIVEDADGIGEAAELLPLSVRAGLEPGTSEPGPEFEPDMAGDPETADGLLAALDMAQRSAVEARDCDVRGRSALYRAISDAYDFALAAQDAPEDYGMMLEAGGITVQERSPMTAVVKLVFGASYDKTRVAEYALALDYAATRKLPRRGLAVELESHEGGLKGLVRDMRAARKAGETDHPARGIERAVKKLGRAEAMDADALPFDENGLAVVVARREADGSITLVAGIDLADKAAQKVAIAASKLV